MTSIRTATLAATLCTLALVLDAASAAEARAVTLSPPATDAELMHQALHACRSLSRRRRPQVDLGLFGRLLDLERELGVPEAYRGMTIAKACIESGYSPRSRGDCKDGNCKAVGMIQLWPWTQRFGVDRSDPVASVRFLLGRVKLGVEGDRVARICGRKRVRNELDAFRLAWLRINRGPLQHGRQRCAGTPHGLSRLRQWQRNIAKARRAEALADRRAAALAAREARRAAAARASAGALHAIGEDNADADQPALAQRVGRGAGHSLGRIPGRVAGYFDRPEALRDGRRRRARAPTRGPERAAAGERRPGGAATARLPQR
jgi:hypothetical protein